MVQRYAKRKKWCAGYNETDLRANSLLHCLPVGLDKNGAQVFIRGNIIVELIPGLAGKLACPGLSTLAAIQCSAADKGGIDSFENGLVYRLGAYLFG